MQAKDAVHTPTNALTLNEELIELRKHVRERLSEASMELALPEDALHSFKENQQNEHRGFH